MKRVPRYLMFVTVGLVLLFMSLYVFQIRDSSSSNKSAVSLSHAAFEREVGRLTALFDPSDTDKSFAYAREQLSQNPSFAKDCHPLMHRFAHETYDKYQSYEVALSQADELCNSGYIHGLIETRFSEVENVAEVMQSSCGQFQEVFAQWQCFHGIGHGVMYVTSKDVAKSVVYCESITNTLHANACINGVFMERFIVVNHAGKHTESTEVSADLCQSQPKKFKADCYFYAPTAQLERDPGDYKNAVRSCEDVERSYVQTCIAGVGSQSMKDNILDPAFSAELCDSLQLRHRKSCVRGAVSLLANHAASTKRVAGICTSAFKSYSVECNGTLKELHQLLQI